MVGSAELAKPKGTREVPDPRVKKVDPERFKRGEYFIEVLRGPEVDLISIVNGSAKDEVNISAEKGDYNFEILYYIFRDDERFSGQLVKRIYERFEGKDTDVQSVMYNPGLNLSFLQYEINKIKPKKP